MGSNLYAIGLSGLQSSRARIDTTGQNTSNVDTAGYSRQKTSTIAEANGTVRIKDTARIVDKFVNEQVRNDVSAHSYYDTYHSIMSTSDQLLGEKSVSLNAYLSKTFKAIQDVNNDPTSSSLRDIAFSNIKDLVQHYHTLSNLVGEQKSIADKRLSTSVAELNNITGQIAQLNGDILKEETRSTSPANELRDRQEELAKKLSGYLHIKVDYSKTGVMTVALANGQPLVMDKTPTKLKVEEDPKNPQNKKLYIDFGKYEVGVNNENLGGSIGALVDYSADFAVKSDRLLGQSAISIADRMNQQNKLGLDGDGNFGQDLFRIGRISFHAGQHNIGNASDLAVRVTPGKSAEITTDTYELSKTDNNRFLIKAYDEHGHLRKHVTEINTSTMKPDDKGYYQVPGLGFDIRLGDISKYSINDVYNFSPTEGAATGLSLQANSGEDLALRAPIGVQTNPNNMSDAKLTLTSVTNTHPDRSAFKSSNELYQNAPHSIVFTGDHSFEVRDGRGNALAKVNNMTNFKDLLTQAGLAKEAGFDLSLQGSPKAGDEFDLGPQFTGAADDYNGLKLVSLQDKPLIGGKTSLSESFADLVASVGSKTASLETNKESSDVVMNQSIARRDSISGVSLDEEAVNLLKYQQAYSASAQVITAARSTFDTLLAAMR
ncbi:flagellar hook-associated protein FlgK [Marinomonas spartinae]|uniref:flagellar hook-associated protein FlgK n=1 Tax=Marinomonas spartinae TaxID=1792290 RepID=UPI0018F1CD45|nr:flagellar hook-associated protein FlgK [Marinomonas spartinae]MBJ7552781.1 flagellar hook-associated protein FlgK [Marinomonas spartinae]